MPLWTLETLNNAVLNFSTFSSSQMNSILELMNKSFPPKVYHEHCLSRRNALQNSFTIRKSLDGAHQNFPSYILTGQLKADPSVLKGFGLVFTAGGEGERLRLSLLKRGVPAEKLNDFTKATFPLPDFCGEFGTLQINLAMISHFCQKAQIDIPVVVTTGPKNSTTAIVIPQILDKYKNFGLKHVKVIAQDERLHLTMDEKVVFCQADDSFAPVTQPDETGGPLMKLKAKDAQTGTSVIDWFGSLGCTKTILMQATAIYEQHLLPFMAEALGNHDCCGVGIMRASFPETDPFGTYISLEKDGKHQVVILEQDMRNEQTRSIKNSAGNFFLPFNTGFYAFSNELLQTNDLPDFATPPKEIVPNLPRSPKIGYAATDLIAKAKNPIVLAIDQSMFGVLKTADDLTMLSGLGKKFSLDQLCKSLSNHL